MVDLSMYQPFTKTLNDALNEMVLLHRNLLTTEMLEVIEEFRNIGKDVFNTDVKQKRKHLLSDIFLQAEVKLLERINSELNRKF